MESKNDRDNMRAEHTADKLDENSPLYKFAEQWWAEKGNSIPPADSAEYEQMYERWAEYAFGDF